MDIDRRTSAVERAVPLDTSRRQTTRLRVLLVGTDVVVTAAAWLVVLLTSRQLPPGQVLSLTAVAVVTTTVVAERRGLYLARISAVRALETVALVRTCALAGVGVYVVSRLAGISVTVAVLLLGTTVSFLALTAGRAGYRSWLARHRRAGRHLRPVVLVGLNDAGLETAHLLRDHPESGLRLVGVVGEPSTYRRYVWGAPHLGRSRDAGDVCERVGATGAVVILNAITTDELNTLVRDLHTRRLHVQLVTGLRRVSRERLRTLPLVREPFLYLEPRDVSRSKMRLKRLADVVAATIGVVVMAPVLAAVALAIRMLDGAPVLFRQERVGRHGEHFMMYKFRSMAPDAERRSVLDNDRAGPLRKVAGDPRVTRLGRLLRSTSLDELPQLFNVLRGEMSLVGPRPALPNEVSQFDSELLARHDVLPGITGLWQLEGRDHPSFSVYQRLDLHYVENWSLTLDGAILISTVAAVAGRALRRGGLDGTRSDNGGAGSAGG